MVPKPPPTSRATQRTRASGSCRNPAAARLLGVLARAHLIQATGAGRYQMHDLLRAYAARMAAAHDSDEARREALTRLFDYYLAASAAAADHLGPIQFTARPDPPSVTSPSA